MDSYNTGDIVIFCYRGWKGPWDIFSHIIEWCSPLPYSHCGIYLKDPNFSYVDLKGEYIWESVINDKPDAEDNKKKYGIKITPLQEYIDNYNGSISIRKILYDNKPFIIPEDKLSLVQKTVHNKPYDIDPADWMRELLKCKDPEPQKTDRFWCSAFVGFFLTKIGFLNSQTDWSILKPCAFAETDDLKKNKGYSLSDIVVLKK